jgi:hypothetical protein
MPETPQLPTISPGEVVSAATVTQYGGGNPQRGIRYAGSAKGVVRRCAIVVSRATDAPYEDRIEGDRVIYTGEGLHSDQSLTRGNLVLSRNVEEDYPLYGFEHLGPNRYRYIGRLRVIGYGTEVQADSDGRPRTVYVFRMRVI